MKNKYKLAKKIKIEYNRIRKEEIKMLSNKSPQEKLKLFEELQELVYEFYKTGRNYVKGNINKSKPNT